MDDRVPRLIGLLLAGAVVLLGLRTQLGGTPQGERIYRAILLVFLLVALGAGYLLVSRPDPEPPVVIPSEDSTVA